MTYHEQLRELGLTQEAAAAAIGVHRTTVGRWCGMPNPPRIAWAALDGLRAARREALAGLAEREASS